MKRLACIILIATILVGGLFFVKTTHATIVSGTLTVDTHWTQNDSPINFNGTVTVANNVTLTIDPGVTVNLGMYALFVSGTLNATGDPSNEIMFTASAIYNFTQQTLMRQYFSLHQALLGTMPIVLDQLFKMQTSTKYIFK